jgi:gas vesicle protein
MFLIRLLFSPMKLALFVIGLLGYRRLVTFAVGVAIGLCFAPMAGRELRDRLREEIEVRTGAAPAAL